MYKIIGLFLAGSALAGFLYVRAQSINTKYNNLKELIKALTYLKQELSFSAGELSGVFRRISEKTNSLVSQVFLNIADILEERPTDFYSAWKKVTDGKGLFTKEAENLMSDFSQNLGKKSLDIELENIEKSREILMQIEEYEREKTTKDKKLTYTLGVSFGVALVILVI